MDETDALHHTRRRSQDLYPHVQLSRLGRTPEVDDKDEPAIRQINFSVERVWAVPKPWLPVAGTPRRCDARFPDGASACGEVRRAPGIGLRQAPRSVPQGDRSPWRS